MLARPPFLHSVRRIGLPEYHFVFSRSEYGLWYVLPVFLTSPFISPRYFLPVSVLDIGEHDDVQTHRLATSLSPYSRRTRVSPICELERALLNPELGMECAVWDIIHGWREVWKSIGDTCTIALPRSDYVELAVKRGMLAAGDISFSF